MVAHTEAGEHSLNFARSGVLHLDGAKRFGVNRVLISSALWILLQVVTTAASLRLQAAFPFVRRSIVLSMQARQQGSWFSARSITPLTRQRRSEERRVGKERRCRREGV